MDLALNDLQRLICRKTQPTKQTEVAIKLTMDISYLQSQSNQ